MGRLLITVMTCFVLLTAGGAPGTATAQPGDLDPAFGSDGRVAALGGDGFVARAVEVAPDGRIVVAGYSCRPADGRDGTCRTSGSSSFRMVRYTPDGRLDTSFGSGGTVTTAVGITRSQAFDVLLLPDGRILLGGVARDGGGREGFALVRFDAAGTIDRSFGEQGSTIVAVGEGFAGIADLAAGPGGSVIAVGVARAGGADRMAIARFSPDGALDGGFGSGGVVLGGPGAHAAGLAAGVAPGGEVVAGGISGASAAPADTRLGLWRVTGAGVPDERFAGGGGLLLNVGSSISFANALTVLRDGRTLAAGSAVDADGRQVMAFVRVTGYGRLDATWDGDGVALVRVGDGALAADAVRDPQGRLLAFGQTAAGGSDWTFAVARLGPDGLLDRGFGTGGVAITTFEDVSAARATAGALMPDGGLVAAGVACLGGYGAQCDGGSPRLALARYMGGGPLQAPRDSEIPGVQQAPFVTLAFPGRPARRRSFVVRLRVTCLLRSACRTRLSIATRGAVRLPSGRRTRRPVTLAASSRRIPAGATREVRLRLRSTGRWLLRRSRRIPVRVVASGRAPGGAAVKVTRAATLTIR